MVLITLPTGTVLNTEPRVGLGMIFSSLEMALYSGSTVKELQALFWVRVAGRKILKSMPIRPASS